MKLLLIESYLNKFDGLRNSPKKNLSELDDLKDDIYNVITAYESREKTNKSFINILHHIVLDVDDTINTVFEELNSNSKGRTVWVKP